MTKKEKVSLIQKAIRRLENDTEMEVVGISLIKKGEINERNKIQSL